MELVEGGTLADSIRQRSRSGSSFSVGEAIALTLQVARGLADAHHECLVHRDIKPANLLLGCDGVLHIADFGLVRILDEHSLTAIGTILGTPQYLSPEQGRGITADARGDIYSLGVVMYELLTMRLPFSGSTVEELIAQHNFTEPAAPSTLAPGISQAVDAVCLTCLQKNPARRYRDALALASDLQRVTQGLAPMSVIRPSGRLTTGADMAVARLAGGHRPWLGAAGLLATVALILAGWWWWWDERKTEIAVLRDRLAPVLIAGPVPPTAAADLARLAEMTCDTDALVAVGRAKLAKVEQASLVLTEFARQATPDQMAIAASEAALDSLIAATGPHGHPQISRWRQRLRDADRLFHREPVHQRLRRWIVRLMADAGDPGKYRCKLTRIIESSISNLTEADVARSKGSDAEAELASLRLRLEFLETPRILPEWIDVQLSRYESLAGSRDPRAIAWRMRYEAIRALESTREQPSVLKN